MGKEGEKTFAWAAWGSSVFLGCGFYFFMKLSLLSGGKWSKQRREYGTKTSSPEAQEINRLDLWAIVTKILVISISQGREMEKKLILCVYWWEGKVACLNLAVSDWSFVNNCLPSQLGRCEEPATQAGGGKVIGFHCSPNKWHLTQICLQSPQPGDACLLVIWRMRLAVGFCPQYTARYSPRSDTLQTVAERDKNIPSISGSQGAIIGPDSAQLRLSQNRFHHTEREMAFFVKYESESNATWPDEERLHLGA